MAAPFGYIQGQRTDDIPFFKASGEWAPLHPPTTGSALVHSGSNNGLSWASYATLLGNLTHNELSATHADSNAGAVARGALIYGNTTPKWDKLTVGAASTVLRSDGTDPSWGTIGAAYIDDRTRSIEITKFTIQSGTPDEAIRGANLRYTAWAFDSAAIEGIATPTFQVPRDWSTGALTVALHWTNLGAGSGDVVWRVVMHEIAPAADLNATAGEANTDNTITAPAQNIHSISTHTVSFTPSAAGVHVILVVARIGNAAADTLGNDAGLLKVQIAYTAVY